MNDVMNYLKPIYSVALVYYKGNNISLTNTIIKNSVSEHEALGEVINSLEEKMAGYSLINKSVILIEV